MADLEMYSVEATCCGRIYNVFIAKVGCWICPECRGVNKLGG